MTLSTRKLTGAAFKHPMPVFDRRKSVVDISHVPMQVLHPLMAADVLAERVEHLSLKIVVIVLDRP